MRVSGLASGLLDKDAFNGTTGVYPVDTRVSAGFAFDSIIIPDLLFKPLICYVFWASSAGRNFPTYQIVHLAEYPIPVLTSRLRLNWVSYSRSAAGISNPDEFLSFVRLPLNEDPAVPYYAGPGCLCAWS